MEIWTSEVIHMQVHGDNVYIFAFCLVSTPADPTCDASHTKEVETKYTDGWWKKQRAKRQCFVSRNQKRPGQRFFVFFLNETRAKSGFISGVSFFLQRFLFFFKRNTRKIRVYFRCFLFPVFRLRPYPSGPVSKEGKRKRTDGWKWVVALSDRRRSSFWWSSSQKIIILLFFSLSDPRIPHEQLCWSIGDKVRFTKYGEKIAGQKWWIEIPLPRNVLFCPELPEGSPFVPQKRGHPPPYLICDPLEFVVIVASVIDMKEIQKNDLINLLRQAPKGRN